MIRHRWLFGITLLGANLFTPLQAQVKPTPAALAGRIDLHLEAKHAENEIIASPLADDAEFLRRVYLDLTGRIPTVSEVYRFLDNKSPDKRTQLVNELLQKVGYINHFTHVWRDALLPASANQQARALGTQMEGWLQVRLRENAPLDRMVREILTAEVVNNGRQPLQSGAQYNIALRAYFQANEFKPENLAGSASRLFLGVKLECAQCHNHPFAAWSQEQFWELAAFFNGFQFRQAGQNTFFANQENATVRSIDIPEKNKKVNARFLDGTEPEWTDGANPREVFADWVVSKKNPYFARAMANRLWAHFFGLGLVDPIDEFGEENPPSHPELLDELAQGLLDNDYDATFIIRAIVLSKAYQRTSTMTHPTQDDPRMFARMALKGLTGEQLFDSLAVATGYQDNAGNQAQRPGFLNPGSVKGQFLTRFDNTVDKRTEQQTSILQALAMMNGQLTADVTSLARSRALSAIADSPFMDDRQRVQTLFLTTLSRPMRPEEEARFLAYVARGGPSGDRGKALADVFWVLLNSSEFCLNH